MEAGGAQRHDGESVPGQLNEGVVACTIVAQNYLPMARVVARSFLEHHSNARFVVVVVDRPLESRSLDDECFEVLPITDIDFGAEGFEYMATSYGVTEFATAVKPFALRHLVRQATCVLYLDPDIRVYAPLDPLIEATRCAGWSLTPHCLEPIRRDGSGPTERDIMQAGIYNLGYIGVTPSATPFLDWWAARLRRDALIDPQNQLFTDQRWIDLAVPIYSPHIERSPAYNVAYWNLDQRSLRLDGDTVMIGGEPLRFFHFSGFDPEFPYWLTKYHDSPRSLMSAQPELMRLCDDYAEEVRTLTPAGEAVPYGWSEAFPGYSLSPRIRQMFREELLLYDRGDGRRPPSPFVHEEVCKFRDWLMEFPSDQPRRIPRYLSAILDERGDLRAAFPEVEKGDNERFDEWVAEFGVGECPEIGLLGYPSVPEVAQAEDRGRATEGIDLIGYLNAELGVGEAGRLAGSALAEAGVRVSTISCRRTTSRQNHPFRSRGVAEHATVLLAVNADQCAAVRDDFGDAFFEGRHVIGQWFWEIEDFPTSYHDAYGMVDEVWAPSKHIEAAIGRFAPDTLPIVHMPLPLVAPAVRGDAKKADFGLDERFTFMFSFDFLSVMERKNPFAVIDGFKAAFEPNEGPQLLIKSINGAERLRDLEHLRWAARDRPDIFLVDAYFDSIETGSLMNVIDCYVSLHRAEGLGLTMSEAMCLGKPVIATAYSGNMSFMDETNALLVPYELTEVGDDAAPYDSTALWADPDLDAAAVALRRVVDDPDGVALVVEAALQQMRRLSPADLSADVGRHLLPEFVSDDV